MQYFMKEKKFFYQVLNPVYKHERSRFLPGTKSIFTFPTEIHFINNLFPTLDKLFLIWLVISILISFLIILSPQKQINKSFFDERLSQNNKTYY
jgi:hypothetical protein